MEWNIYMKHETSVRIPPMSLKEISNCVEIMR